MSFELEINGERDLDRAVDRMNTDRAMAVVCERPSGFAGAPAESPPSPPLASEWMAGAGYGWSIGLLRAQSGRHYAVQTVSWAHDVMRDGGHGILRGRLVWAIEAMPIYWQFAPTSTHGVGVLPLVWRWRFAPRPRGQAFAELAFELPPGPAQYPAGLAVPFYRW